MLTINISKDFMKSFGTFLFDLAFLLLILGIAFLIIRLVINILIYRELYPIFTEQYRLEKECNILYTLPYRLIFIVLSVFLIPMAYMEKIDWLLKTGLVLLGLTMLEWMFFVPIAIFICKIKAKHNDNYYIAIDYLRGTRRPFSRGKRHISTYLDDVEPIAKGLEDENPNYKEVQKDRKMKSMDYLDRR